MRPSRAPLISAPGGPRGSYNHQGVRRAPIGRNQPVKRNLHFAQLSRTIMRPMCFSSADFGHVSQNPKLIGSLRAPQTSDGPRNSSVASPQIALRKSPKIFGRPFPGSPLDSSTVVKFAVFNVKIQFCAANPGNERLRGPGGSREYSQSIQHRILP